MEYLSPALSVYKRAICLAYVARYDSEPPFLQRRVPDTVGPPRGAALSDYHIQICSDTLTPRVAHDLFRRKLVVGTGVVVPHCSS